MVMCLVGASVTSDCNQADVCCVLGDHKMDGDTCNVGSYIPHAQSRIRLDMFSSENEMCVYCACGRIVALDKSEMQLKISLGKNLECMSCRNRRIANEIDYLNNLYDGLIDEGSY